MGKLDRLDWTTGVVIAPFGTRLGIRINDARFMPQVIDCIPQEWATQKGGPCDLLISLKVAGQSQRHGVKNFHLLYAGINRLVRSLDFEEITSELRHQVLSNIFITTQTHAVMQGTVLEIDGQGVLFPGRGTDDPLLHPFLEKGAVVHSKNLICIGSDGIINPLPTHDRISAHPLPLVCAYVASGSSQRKRTRLDRQTAGQAATLLFAMSMSARFKPAPLLSSLNGICSRVPLYVAHHSAQSLPGPELWSHYHRNFGQPTPRARGLRDRALV